MRPFLLLLALPILLFSCKPEVHSPKPRGYYHIDLPKRAYKQLESDKYPYTFEYPTYAQTVDNPSFFGEKPENPYWMNIDFPSVGGRIYISYNAITPGQDLNKLNEDMYTMTFTAHDKKADYIADFYFQDTARKVYGLLYNVTGDAASAYQFYATDSARHFIRGALYFDVAPNADSLKPVNDFLREDINHLLQTLRWR